MATPQFRALLVGNWEYASTDGGMPPLNGPQYDLARLREAFTHPEFGLIADQARIDVKENLTSNQLRTELYRIASTSEPDETLLIYYSGHGERLGQDQNLGLLGVDVPYDERGGLAVNTSELSAWLDSARARSKIVILDCCYSGQFRGPLEESVVESFGEGTWVLASGGNQVVQDQVADGRPSPFTEALANVLVDEALTGTDGWLTTDDVYEALDRYDPRLDPRPKRSMRAQGQLPLARRARPVLPAAGIPGWPDELDVVRVALTFTQTHVVAEWDQDGNGRVSRGEREASALELSQLAAVRRLCELSDAVMRARDYGDPSWQRRARRAIEAAGAILFDTAIPDSLKELIQGATRNQLVRLDLDFEDPWQLLAELPWEYLNLPRAADTPSDAIRRRIVVSRVRARTSGGPSAPTSSPTSTAGPGNVTDVVLVNTLPSPQDRLADRIRDELDTMEGARALIATTGKPARWDEFLDAVDQMPHYLVLCAPLRRERTGERPVARVGFADDDFRDPSSLVSELERVGNLRAVVLVTVSTEPGSDAIRAAPMVAEELSSGLHVPVVFACHSPGLERYVGQRTGSDPQTFVGLLLTALTQGKPLDQSVWYARERVLRFIPQELVSTFGNPGFFVDPDFDPTMRPGARSTTGRPHGMPATPGPRR